MSRRIPHVRMVLVRPRNPLNLLAGARAAANFGFDDVVVVSPYGPTWEEARAAPEAGKWLRQARRVATLAEAIGDRNWVLGTSCLSRRQTEEQRIISIEHVRKRSTLAGKKDRIALLFGPEKRGLTNQDLALCHAVVRIPTAGHTPSMNLGQAVAVCCYELRHWGQPLPPAQPPPAAVASMDDIEQLLGTLARILHHRKDAGLKELVEKKRRERLRRMLMRLPLTRQDASLILGVLRDISWRLSESKR